jgi:Holliday junction resolvase RusA-like endonuclease
MKNFLFEIEPVPASRPRVARFGTYYLPRYAQFKKDMAKLLTVMNVKRFYTEDPLIMDVTFFIPIPKSYSKKKTEEIRGEYSTARIDLDNLEKSVYDALNGVLYKDDSQIVMHTVCKRWKVGAGQIGVSFKTIYE